MHFSLTNFAQAERLKEINCVSNIDFVLNGFELASFIHMITFGKVIRFSVEVKAVTQSISWCCWAKKCCTGDLLPTSQRSSSSSKDIASAILHSKVLNGIKPSCLT